MRKILIALLFIVSIVAISCQLDSTRPKRKSNVEGENTEETVIVVGVDLKNISIDFGEGQNKHTFNVHNNWTGTTILLPLVGDGIEDAIDGFSYEIESATRLDYKNRNVKDWFSISTETETDGKVKGPKLTLREVLKNEITITNIAEIELSILVKDANNNTGTLKCYLLLNRQN